MFCRAPCATKIRLGNFRQHRRGGHPVDDPRGAASCTRRCRRSVPRGSRGSSSGSTFRPSEDDRAPLSGRAGRPDSRDRRQGRGEIRVIAGRVGKTGGAVTEIAADPTYLDILVPARSAYRAPLERGIRPSPICSPGAPDSPAPAKACRTPSRRAARPGRRDELRSPPATESARFLLVSGKPLHEPIARYGPFVHEPGRDRATLEDLRRGTFVR